MMRPLFTCILLLIGALCLVSCSTTDKAASNGLFQKRKYSAGWHTNWKRQKHYTKHIAATKTVITKAIVVERNPPIIDPPEHIMEPSWKETGAENRAFARRVEQKIKVTPVLSHHSDRVVVSNESKPRKQEGHSMASFLSVLVAAGLLPFSIPVIVLLVMTVAAVVLGAIGVKRVNDNRNEFKGEGFGLAGLITGLIFTFSLLIYLASWLTADDQ